MHPPRQAGLPQGLIIIAISLLPMMAIVALMPIVPLLVKQFQHVPHIETLAPLVLSAPGLCVALLSPYAGVLADRLGRRRLLIAFAVTYGLGGMLPFFLHSFEALLIGRLLLGVGEAFILTMSNTLLGDYFEPRSRARWLMWQGIVGSVCGSGLLALSGHLASHGWNIPFLVYGVALLIAAAAMVYVYEPQRATVAQSPAHAQPTLEAFPRRTVLGIMITTFVLSALYFVYTLQFSLVLDALGLKQTHRIGNYSAVASAAVPLGAILFKLLAGRSAVLQFTVLFMLLGGGMMGIGLSSDLPSVVGFAFMQQLGAGMCIPILIGWGLRELPDRFRGRGMGLWTSAFFLGQFVSPFFFTLVRGWTGGYPQAFVTCGVICMAIALGNLIMTRRATTAAMRPVAR